MSRGATVCVSMFDYLTLAFHNKLDGYGKEPRIVIVTGINPKMVSGKLYLNGTSATRIYFDSETAVGKVELPSVDPDQSGSSSKVVHAQKIEPMTVSELNQFVLTADPQIIEFLCTAKVTEIQLDEGWSYIGCSVCSKKLTREETSFACVPCNETNAVAKLRYRVILSVSDATGAAAFLGFDTEMSKLTHVLASEAAQIVGIGTNAQVDVVLPRPLADLVGRTYTFQLKLKDFNFTPNHQTFTISRIFPQRELAPNPTFAEEDVEVIEPAIPQGATVCVSMFDYLALAFHNKLDGYGKEPRIVIVTGINPKMVSGKLYPNGTSATRIYFDSETAVGKVELPGVDPDQSGSTSKVVHAQKIEPMTVSELNQFVLTADPQIIEFLCTAKVIEIQLDEGWSYIGCSVCSKKLTREETSFACAHVMRPMLWLNSAAFLGFDTEMSKLTHVLASKAAQIVGIGTNTQVGVVLPRPLADLVGRTYTFQLKLKDFNFTPNHQTFTISRIFPQRELAPNPTFAEEDVEVIEPAIPQSAAERLGDKDATTSNVAEQSTVATDAEGTEQAARKKARVE
ncbi:hypothetical protein F2Q69_00025341 [Brassica cretica]|uniref:Replication factor A C-terminal domain-containing protein n=1 Tax=Brassica cretica TaxID=69181 RepID=A0A8S9Q8M5_BRACR|nr:hypothetical protein F2Q69_00025341 [Brassica cretica]